MGAEVRHRDAMRSKLWGGVGDSGSKPGQGRVFTGGQDERGHGEVGLSTSYLWLGPVQRWSLEGSRRLQRGGADESRPAKLHTKHSC